MFPSLMRLNSIRSEYAAILLALAWLGGCATLTSPPDASPPEKRPIVSTPRVAPPTNVIVLQSDASPAYAEVASEIVKQWRGGVEVILIAKESAAGIQRRVQASETQDVIAIGLPAARAARSLAGKKVVFCQVFNYDDEDLIRPWMKGVSALPPAQQQFKAWKELDPKLSHVAVIVGKGLDDLMSEARGAAQVTGIRLQHIQVNSDLALRSAVRRLGTEVQGLWLVPDNRVLSHKALREVIEQSRERGRQVLVMNRQLLSWGATLSVDSDAGDIARQAISRLHAAAGQAIIPGPDITALTKTNITSRQNHPAPQVDGKSSRQR